VHNEASMTGEISLRGPVLTVGGIKETGLVAVAAGMKRMMMPARKRKNLEEVPSSAKAQVEFIFLDSVGQAVQATIGLKNGWRGLWTP
jgi:ATP-dependent Lon protease